MRFPFAQGASEAIGTATAAEVLSGVTFSTAQLIGASGSMPNQGAVTLTASGTGPVSIPAGYHNGSGVVSQVDVPAANVLTGTTIAGVSGAMPNNSSSNGYITPTSIVQSSGSAYFRINKGAYLVGTTGTGGASVEVQGTDPNFIASNILSSVSIFGLTGSIPMQGSPTLQPGASIIAGYYSGGSAASPGSGSQTFSTPGTSTWTAPSGVTRVFAQLWGGGGGGACEGGCGGGGGGGYVAGFVDVNPGQGYSVTVGAGGTASVWNTNAATAGGNSTFSSLSAGGGGAGDGQYNGSNGSSPGGGGGGAFDNASSGYTGSDGGGNGGYGSTVGTNGTSYALTGTIIVLGGGGGGPGPSSAVGGGGGGGGAGSGQPGFAGGTSTGGFGGGQASSGTCLYPGGSGGTGGGNGGTNGSAPGGGGGGGNNNGGNGAPGQVILSW